MNEPSELELAQAELEKNASIVKRLMGYSAGCEYIKTLAGELTPPEGF